MLLKKVEVNPYHVELWIVVSDNPAIDYAQLNVQYPGLGMEWGKDWAAFTNDHFYKDYILSVMLDVNYTDVGIIAHEVAHIKNMIFGHADIKHDPKNDEPEAYLSGWLASQLYQAWQEFKQTKKNGRGRKTK